MDAPTTLSSLPLDIVTLILKQLTGDNGIITLWLVYRHVSKTWRLVVEHIFIVRELPVTSIMILISWDSKHYEGDPNDWKDLHGPFQFRIYAYDRVQDENKKAAVFTMEDLESRQRCSYQEEFAWGAVDHDRRPREADRTYPCHIVRSRRFANDTEISSCHLEGKSRTQLLCDWRLLLTNLLVEDYRVQRRTLSNVSKHDLRRVYDPSWVIEENLLDDGRSILIKVNISLNDIEHCRYESQRAERRLRIATQRDKANPDEWVMETIQQEDCALERVVKDRAELLDIDFDDDESVLIKSLELQVDDEISWGEVEREKIRRWWLSEAIDIANEEMEPARKERKFSQLAKKMKQQKLWWREAEDSVDSNHLVDEERMDHTEEHEEDALPGVSGTLAVEVRQSIENLADLECLHGKS